ncbi:MAG: ribbon-helix-helix domain-containing protein [bacterium]
MPLKKRFTEKIIVSATPEQKRKLKRLSLKEDTPMASLIRKAIKEFLEKQ